MIAFTLFIGLTDRDGRNFTRQEVEDALVDHLTNQWHIDCYTITYGVGYWQGDREECAQVYISAGLDFTNAQAIARDLAWAFNQEAVGIREENSIVCVSHPSN